MIAEKTNNFPIVQTHRTTAPIESIPDPVIAVRNVSKIYRIYDRPEDRLKQMLTRGRREYGREFWALRDVSFSVQRGETVGIIGRNGSGKSTLLQIITGTLAPTAGEVQVQGRVAALLELGSGFNPEFTGRENVFLNGAILGFTREQIAQRFDEIAAFADIGEFIEQPVKLYSSGMLVRLAFAVQACVEPDILIVDEALSVGDIFFQQKCYRRIEELREQGTSILFVSHNMGDVRQFCRRAIFLQHGEIVFAGGASDAVAQYMLHQQPRASHSLPQQPQETGNILPTIEDAIAWPQDDAAFFSLIDVPQITGGAAYCTAAALCDAQSMPKRVFEQGETARIFYEFELKEPIAVPIGGFNIENDKSILVFGKNALQYDTLPLAAPIQAGQRVRFQHDVKLDIAAGEYTIEVGLATTDSQTYAQRALFAADDLYSRVTRLCHLNPIGGFAVVAPREHRPALPTHFGIANLPGEHTFQICG